MNACSSLAANDGRIISPDLLLLAPVNGWFTLAMTLPSLVNVVYANWNESLAPLTSPEPVPTSVFTPRPILPVRLGVPITFWNNCGSNCAIAEADLELSAWLVAVPLIRCGLVMVVGAVYRPDGEIDPTLGVRLQ